MKKLIVFSAIAVCLTFSKTKAQTVNGVRLTEIRSDYIEVKEGSSVWSRKVYISLNYGQQIVNERKSTYVKDDDGNDMEFNSALDFVNKLKSYGYELFQAYSQSIKDSDATKIYVLKRK